MDLINQSITGGHHLKVYQLVRRELGVFIFPICSLFNSEPFGATWRVSTSNIILKLHNHDCHDNNRYNFGRVLAQKLKDSRDSEAIHHLVFVYLLKI